MGDRLVAEISTTQHTAFTTDIHAPGWIRTSNLRRRAAADLRLRPRGNWDRQLLIYLFTTYLLTYLPTYLLTTYLLSYLLLNYLPTYLSIFLLTYLFNYLLIYLLTNYLLIYLLTRVLT